MTSSPSLISFGFQVSLDAAIETSVTSYSDNENLILIVIGPQFVLQLVLGIKFRPTCTTKTGSFSPTLDSAAKESMYKPEIKIKSAMDFIEKSYLV
jgi:hypothetical protein